MSSSTIDTSERPKIEPPSLQLNGLSELEYGETVHTKPAFINYVAAIFA